MQRIDNATEGDSDMEMARLSTGEMLSGDDIDANANRERTRQKRLKKWFVILAVVLTYLVWRLVNDNQIRFGVPGWLMGNPEIIIALGLILILGTVIFVPFLTAGKSPHTLLRASDSNVRLDDVVGADQTKREAIDSMNLFLASETFQREMGGNARKGVLFEGPPGTGKTYLAKAMAAEAGVPFLFVSASEFQSMYYGQTNKKIRSFFKALRKAARDEGGAIGYIEEFDAIGGARSGMNTGSQREGIVGVVNELLVQMQSFDLPTGRQKFKTWWIDWFNGFLPDAKRRPRPARKEANILIVAATNRAADLDPALLRPGRFDRVIGFNLPPRSDRLEIAQYYLDKKNHEEPVTAALIADLSAGYTPVKIEKLLDEALIIALRSSRTSMTMNDVLQAQLVTEVGVAHEMGYHPDERRRIAIHEAGHALTAVLTRRDVKMASILRRSAALGLVAHGDVEERFLKTPSDAARSDRRRPRRTRRRTAGVRRSIERHLVRPCRGHQSRLAARRPARKRPGAVEPRCRRDAHRRKPRGEGALRRVESRSSRGVHDRGSRSCGVDDFDLPRCAPADR